LGIAGLFGLLDVGYKTLAELQFSQTDRNQFFNGCGYIILLCNPARY
jgi:hypothetical protein